MCAHYSVIERVIRKLYLLLAVVFLLYGAANAAGHRRYAANEVIVKYKSLPNGVPAAGSSLDKFEKKHGVHKARIFGEIRKKRHARLQVKTPPDLSSIYTVHLDTAIDPEAAAQEYRKDPNVEYAEPNYLQEMSAVPNDPSFGTQWALRNTGQGGGTPGGDISATGAWDISTGNGPVVIAVVDTGIDLTHEDLSSIIWKNTDETSGNSTDDDNNGYVDDVQGWNFSDNNNDANDTDGHGTHCAGIIAAQGNNGRGISGVLWNTRVMPLKVFPNAYADVCAKAIRYAVDNGASVISNSWGSSQQSAIIDDAIAYAVSQGVVVVFAAGNSNSQAPFYPAANNQTIAVGATDNQDHKSGFSNYGSWVSVCAPGVDIYSTLPNNTYGPMSGTSMSCPFVAGVAGLVLSKNPALTPAQVRDIIVNNADPIDSLNPGYEGLLGGGRLNALAALQGAYDSTPPTGTPSAPSADGTTWRSTTLRFQWTQGSCIDPESGIRGYYLQVGTSPGGNDLFDCYVGNILSKEIAGAENGKTYYARVRAINRAGMNGDWSPSSNGITVEVISDTTPPIFNGPVRDGNYRAEDLKITFSTDTLLANWPAASDPESGISRYFYAFGTSRGGTDVKYWTTVGTNTFAEAGGLQLALNTTYYASVYAENGAGLDSEIRTSNGILVTPYIFKNGLKELTPEEQEMVRQMAVTTVEPNETAVQRYQASPGIRYGLAASAKNYLYLPAVNSQGGQGSCAAWASCYYYKTYQEAREHGWLHPNPAVDPQHVMSPAFGYNLCNGGSDGGSWPATIMSVINTFGIATWQDMPYYDSNCTACPSETAWRNGIAYRGNSTSSINISNDTGINNLKQQINNGDLAVMTMNVYTNFDSYPSNQTGVNNGVYFLNSGTYRGGHALTVIGYDDNKSYFDGTTTKYGAFLIANSWGSWWGATDSDIGTGGFIWIAYDYMKLYAGSYVYTMTDRNNYTPTLYGIYGLNHVSRNSLQVTFQGGDNSASPDWSFTGAQPMPGSFPINQNIVLDLSLFSVNYNRKFWLKVYDSSTNTGTIIYMAVNKVGGYTTSSLDTPKSTVKSANVFTQLLYGQLIDVSSPTAISTVNDGTGADIFWATSNTQLSANWTASSDPESNISRYWYAIGTTPGGTNTAGWTDNNVNTSVTRTGLSLTPGATYYFSVKAENGVGLQSPVTTSNGQVVDASAPTAIATVNDGTGSDITFSTSTSQLSANWTASSDPESGITKYWYAIGLTAGASNVVNWTSNSINTSVTRTGLSLSSGQQYYFSVKAENGTGVQSAVTTSNGVTVDTTAPTGIASVNDGTGPDVDYSTSTAQLCANWTASTDAQSGIVKYWYSIGTAPGATSIVGWTSNGTNLSLLKTGLSLIDGTTYFFNVRSENGAGIQSATSSSNGQYIDVARGQPSDTTPPSNIPYVYDGTGVDIFFTSSTAALSANWGSSSDLESGIARYWYAVGTSPGAANTVTWTDNGLSQSVTRTGLSLTNGATYYFSILAQNGSGLNSGITSSNGQVEDSTPPTTVAVCDGLGADVRYSSSTAQLSCNWTASSDPESGITRYWYCVGTSIGGSDTIDWTDNAKNISVTKYGLSLVEGPTYYFSVKAENGWGIQSTVSSSNGQQIDTTPPAAVPTVNDGTGADIRFSPSASQLSANWTASSDAQSGIAKYWFAVGTTNGGTNILPWTDFGANLSCTITFGGQSLLDGSTYYVSVKAENGAGILSPVTCSNGQMVDSLAPSAVATVNDGTGSDVMYTTSTVQLSANWTPSSDMQSGIAKYWYSIGTSAGATDIVSWTNNGASLSVTKAGLSLTTGIKYFFNIKSENGAGLQSTVSSSDGQKVDTTPPSAPSQVNDGTGPDIAFTSSTVQLSGNWASSVDGQSGIAKYWVAIGTSPGAVNTVGWTDNGINNNFTLAGLTLTNGVTYYITVKSQNGAGLQSSAASSNGQIVDSSGGFFGDQTPPNKIAVVNDGTAFDIAYSTFSTQISANWTASNDPESGIAAYSYAIGTSPGGTEILSWTDNGLSRSATRTGLTLTDGLTYYISVIAINGKGLQSTPTSSNGQLVDASPPDAVDVVNDGPGLDITRSPYLDRLIANWTPTEDPHSGISRYWYAFGTSTSAATIVGWTDNGGQTSVTRAGVSLQRGVTYYCLVQAENGVGLRSSVVASNGQYISSNDPSAAIALAPSSPLTCGKFSVTLTIANDENMIGTPTLSYVLPDAKNVSVVLTGSGSLWTGSLWIQTNTAEGTAHFVFSVKNFAGGTCSSITQGGSFVIDTTVYGPSGGISKNADGAEADLSPNTFSGNLNISIGSPSTHLAEMAAANNALATDSTLRTILGSNLCREFTASIDGSGSPVTHFDRAITVHIPYLDDDNNGIVDGTSVKEDTLRMFYLNETAQRWVLMPDSHVDTLNNFVSATTDHFSIFTLLSLSAYSDSSNVVCFPNPCYLKKDHLLSIGNIPLSDQNVTIFIYSVAGELVRTLREPNEIETDLGGKTGKWDGRNNNNEKVASGAYIFLVKSDRGNHTDKAVIFW